MKLVLPLPPSPNRRNGNPFVEQRAKNEYRERAWVAAIMQSKPLRDPPERVRVAATLYLVRKRDEDNATGSLKYTIDALKQRQTGSLRWRQNAYDECGYFVDDDPDRLVLDKPVQVRCAREDERVEVVVTPLTP